MSKNIYDYIKMGMRSARKIEDERVEKQQKQNKDAQAFNKAFTDKTYTVAKKVMENVEKVADYDYESFFSRVNKVFDEKGPTKKDIKPEERQKRSQEFDDKLKRIDKSFDINNYPASQKNYKDSIIEKTKKNIQKKIEEADNRQGFKSEDRSERLLKQEKEFVETPMESIDEKQLSKLSKIEELSKKDNLGSSLDESEEMNDETIQIPERDKLSNKDLNNDKNDNTEISNQELENVVDENVVDEDESILDELNSSQTTEESEVVKTEAPIDTAKSFDSIETTEPHIKQEADEVIDSIIELEEEFESTFKEVPNVQYTKANTTKNNKYYKTKKREKFAKRMKVELEDTLIAEKQRKFQRLFKFSLSFKLSFVFVFLLIITIVTLSVAFYFGIDYVIELNAQGLMEDIQFFKDVLVVLLILFNLVAILLCISVGTKASRELVRPIDEMTMIVKQINAKDMDRRLNVKGMHDELKELAMTFNEMLNRIENSYETQNRFTSDASHELRTPIAVIQGYINMLDRWGKADGAILEESIEAIKSESNNMKRLTEKLLLLAKADKGILELEFKPFALNELVDEISRETAMIDSNHIITNQINDVEHILADRESLKQAIRIFVDNSVKYTPEGGEISINSYFNKKQIFIEIADNGIGISKDDMDNIFNRFYRVDKSRAKESGGHGLGLSIAKWIVNQHKGEIEIKSELNKGTVVTIILSPMT